MVDKTKIVLLKNELVHSHHSNSFIMGVISACLATIGLVTNSQTTLLGSMLLSPIGSLITKNIIYSFLNFFFKVDFFTLPLLY